LQKTKKDQFAHPLTKSRMIGLIFGETNFPNEVLKKIKILKKNFLIIDLTKNNFFKKEKNMQKSSICWQSPQTKF
jgi:hypothetical protein